VRRRRAGWNAGRTRGEGARATSKARSLEADAARAGAASAPDPGQCVCALSPAVSSRRFCAGICFACSRSLSLQRYRSRSP
jgi:hypothetical protein